MAQNNKGLYVLYKSGASHDVARSWPHHTHNRVSRRSSHVQHCWVPCQGMKRALGDSHWQLNALTCKWHTSLLLSTHSLELVTWSTQPRRNQDVPPLSSSNGKNISKQHSWPAEVFFSNSISTKGWAQIPPLLLFLQHPDGWQRGLFPLTENLYFCLVYLARSNPNIF